MESWFMETPFVFGADAPHKLRGEIDGFVTR